VELTSHKASSSSPQNKCAHLQTRMKILLLFWMCLYAEGTLFDDMVRLRSYVTDTVEKNVRPVSNQSEHILVKVTPYILGYNGLDAKEQTLQSTFSLRLEWTQEILSWNASDFGGLDYVVLSAGQIWTPSIIVSNSVKVSGDSISFSDILVHSNGITQTYASQSIESSCPVDIQWFPFDSQTCDIEFSNGGVRNSDVVLFPSTSEIGVSLDSRLLNQEWKLTETHVSSREIAPGYNRLGMKLTFVRQPLSYVVNVLVPAHILSLMSVLSFKIPLDCGERISYCTSLLLTYVVLIDMVSAMIPNVPKNISLMQIIITYQLAQGALVTVCAILMTKYRVNNSTRTTTKDESKLCVFLTHCCKRKSKVEDIDAVGGHSYNNELDELVTRNETLLNAVDRVLFSFFLCLYVALLTIVIIGLPNN